MSSATIEKEWERDLSLQSEHLRLGGSLIQRGIMQEGPRFLLTHPALPLCLLRTPRWQWAHVWDPLEPWEHLGPSLCSQLQAPRSFHQMGVWHPNTPSDASPNLVLKTSAGLPTSQRYLQKLHLHRVKLIWRCFPGVCLEKMLWMMLEKGAAAGMWVHVESGCSNHARA